MIVERAEHPMFLSNAYLVADEAGGTGVLVDCHEEMEPLLERAESDGIEITHVLLTHHHFDHVDGFERLAERFGVPVLAHEKCRDEVGDGVTGTLADGDEVETGGLRIRALHTPGHCADQLSLVFNDTDVLTADCLFKGTVGGTRAPGATGFADQRASIMDKLMKLDPATRVHPGHREPTTVGDEWEQNAFIRVWRGLDDEGSEPCTLGPEDAAEREPATLVLWAPDYDGGNKAWVRLESGEDAIVGGSQVKREG